MARVFWVLSAFGGALMAVAGVSPQDAASNISAWLEVVGFQNIASWVSAKPADDWALVIGAFIALAGIIGVVYTNSIKANRESERRGNSQSLKRLSNVELRDAIHELAGELRTLEAGAESVSSQTSMRRHHELNDLFKSGESDEEISRRNREFHEASQAETNERNSYFDKRYRAKVLEAEDEGLSRMGDFSKNSITRPLVIRTRMIVGARPIGEVADYLDEIARRLS